MCESCGQPPLQCSLIHGCAVRQGDRSLGEVAHEGGMQSCRGMPTPTLPKSIVAILVAGLVVVAVVIFVLIVFAILLFWCLVAGLKGHCVSVATLLCFKKASNPYVCCCW